MGASYTKIIITVNIETDIRASKYTYLINLIVKSFKI